MNTICDRVINWTRRQRARRLARRDAIICPQRPLISFTFDDFPISALTTGGEILRQHGATGTYYVALGLAGTEQPTGRMFDREDLARAIADGHELGCHTHAHCDAWHTPPAEFAADCARNRAALAELLAPPQFKTLGAEFKTLSYPINYPQPETKRAAAREYVCCRGGGQKINAGTADLNNLSAFFLEKCPDLEIVRRLIAENERQTGWLIFATHDVDSKPTRYGCTPDFFAAVVRAARESSSTILPVFEAYKLAVSDAALNQPAC